MLSQDRNYNNEENDSALALYTHTARSADQKHTFLALSQSEIKSTLTVGTPQFVRCIA